MAQTSMHTDQINSIPLTRLGIERKDGDARIPRPMNVVLDVETVSKIYACKLSHYNETPQDAASVFKRPNVVGTCILCVNFQLIMFRFSEVLDPRFYAAAWYGNMNTDCIVPKAVRSHCAACQ